MLNYPPQFLPVVPKDNDYFRAHDSPHFAPAAMNPIRFQKDSLVSRAVFNPPLAVFTNLSPSSSSSPSTVSAKIPRSPYISSRPISNRVSLHNTQTFELQSRSHSWRSESSSTLEDVLAPGDLVGEGILLQGEAVRLVSLVSHDQPQSADSIIPAKEFEVVRQLGTGSYAVVYLVREVLSRCPPSDDGHMPTIGSMELEDLSSTQNVYGREYAVKCLSKANLDEEALTAQMSEVTIHQSLHHHPNIVTLYRTLETSSFLLLLLEYVPGEDLFYFLEQARDHYEMDNSSPSDSSVSTSSTPPTPSLLSNLHPSQLLSHTRLRLISSMFSQMCDAVAACHAQQIFHRDIKPENFIVTDGWVTAADGHQDRKVIVKLTDFGLSTTVADSSDMDCGSAPYMSYECRNNVAPTYRPRGADVWSLGIVLINMLYHYNPWTDTSEGACSSFDIFRRDPVNFFMYRFTGMTRPVAEFLASKVFCILEDSQDDSPRISTAEFGAWARTLPSLLGGHVMQRSASTSSTQGHPIALSTPMSHRPSSRQPSVTASAVRAAAITFGSLSRAPSLGLAYERPEPCELSTVIDQENEDDLEDLNIESMTSRATSTNKRRKRGTRKGKGSCSVSTAPHTDTLEILAVASQSLAREISKASRSSSHRSSSASHRSRQATEPVHSVAVPVRSSGSRHPSLTTTATGRKSNPTSVAKKPSKWKLSFGKNSAAALAASTVGRFSPVEECSPVNSIESSQAQPMSTTASNVTNLIMGLNAPPNPIHGSRAFRMEEKSYHWNRVRRFQASPPGKAHSLSNNSDEWNLDRPFDRAVSPNSLRSGRPIASSASSMSSGNWRSSMSTTSSASTSTSTFTRYSNSSARSISTTATTISSSSWRTSVKPSYSAAVANNQITYAQLPKNIKIMNGVPWELDQLPRALNPNPSGNIFGTPPVRKQRTRKAKDVKLDTITERPSQPVFLKSEFMNRDASTSSTDLAGLAKEDTEGVKKVQKGQINALAKMLSALRR